jgi:hypothetical protein
MTRSEVESALAAAIEAESKVGLQWSWPRTEMASIAFRRWSSFARRHNTKEPTVDDRVLDLAKGLQAHYEPERLYTPFTEWLHLARILGRVFADAGS